MSSSIHFGLRKRQKIEVPPQAFSDPDEDSDLPESEQDVEAQVKQLQEEGSRYAEDGQYSAAIRTWDRAIAMRPSNAVLHELKAQVLLDAGQPWAAVQSALKATSLDETWPDGFLTLSRAQFNFGEPEEALISINEALRLQPDHPDALREITDIKAQVQRRIGQPVPLRAPTEEPGGALV
ncbi:TPR-like protein [Coccomyxa subellipsoidea C-169]|uniref:TPR-like protein n=1 Tax=Coccomyxa subellipsoidea (strain C-169) TaxID=574566 RepID=I0YVI9_COCSC|nr:TPR-like protein [Coccomyxa subellipsoidea C-169]EIE22408.1 TPR-like protein [Coccomyxa subellipsoidea C-169]|eukprot:XP_005646952.1 TPR-like protein [Coccomyxa subellipsoidea C-169]